ncbi:MAG: hypothetical protein JWM76_3336 [Pseudonocardiales bacterium]|nr:hypothetical protein [Pseudonocardiales bacterium]
MKSRPRFGLLLCRLNIQHHWKPEHNPDGEIYYRCARCGKDRFDSGSAPNIAGNIAGMGGSGFGR